MSYEKWPGKGRRRGTIPNNTSRWLHSISLQRALGTTFCNRIWLQLKTKQNKKKQVNRPAAATRRNRTQVPSLSWPHIRPVSWVIPAGLLGDHPAGLSPGPLRPAGLVTLPQTGSPKAEAYFTTSAEWSLFCICGKAQRFLDTETHI